MPARRRPVPADPLVLARFAALTPPPRGWVPSQADLDAPRAFPPADDAAPIPPPRRDRRPKSPHDPAHPDDPRTGAAAPPHQLSGDDDDGGDDGDHQPGTAAPEAAGAWAHWRGSRLDPGRRGLAALLLVAVLAAALSAGVVLRSRPQAVPAPPVVAAGEPPLPGGPLPLPGGSPAPSSAEVVVVSVAGKVAAPAVLRLPPGSRVEDALRAAGGALPGTDLSGLNPARRVVDGEQVLVGIPQPAGAGAAVGGLLELNSATAEQLDALPGIGPVLATRIVDWRVEHGPFRSVEQLREVGGIGASKFAQLRTKVRV